MSKGNVKDEIDAAIDEVEQHNKNIPEDEDKETIEPEIEEPEIEEPEIEEPEIEEPEPDDFTNMSLVELCEWIFTGICSFFGIDGDLCSMSVGEKEMFMKMEKSCGISVVIRMKMVFFVCLTMSYALRIGMLIKLKKSEDDSTEKKR